MSHVAATPAVAAAPDAGEDRLFRGTTADDPISACACEGELIAIAMSASWRRAGNRQDARAQSWRRIPIASRRRLQTVAASMTAERRRLDGIVEPIENFEDDLMRQRYPHVLRHSVSPFYPTISPTDIERELGTSSYDSSAAGCGGSWRECPRISEPIVTAFSVRMRDTLCASNASCGRCQSKWMLGMTHRRSPPKPNAPHRRTRHVPPRIRGRRLRRRPDRRDRRPALAPRRLRRDRCAEGGVAPRRGRCRRQDRRRRRPPCRAARALLRRCDREWRAQAWPGPARRRHDLPAAHRSRRAGELPHDRRERDHRFRLHHLRLAAGARRRLGDRRQGDADAPRDRADHDPGPAARHRSTPPSSRRISISSAGGSSAR